MTSYKHTAIVKGTYPFPTDMLRYDSCSISAEDEAAVSKAKHGDSMEARVNQFSNSRIPRWTVGRWISFGWSVTHEESLPSKKG